MKFGRFGLGYVGPPLAIGVADALAAGRPHGIEASNLVRL